MEFKKQKPIYLQIAESLNERIMTGEWKEGERMASVRDIAAELGVNPNTVLRSFDHLQGAGIIHMRRGLGYYVADDATGCIFDMKRREFLMEDLPVMLAKIEMYGITEEEINDAKKLKFK